MINLFDWNAVWAFGVFTVGLLFGSFLNVCIRRLPYNQSILYPSSHCMQCRKPILLKDLIPVFSCLRLKGACRFCGRPFSVQYTIVEALTAVLFTLAFLKFSFSLEFLRAIVFIQFIVVISAIDWNHFIILDKVLRAMTIIGAAFHAVSSMGIVDGAPHWTGLVFLSAPGDWRSALAGALCGGGALWAVALVSRGGMGRGDAKLAAALGFWFGPIFIFAALFLAFLFGGAAGSVLLLCKIKKRGEFIAFGPFIAAGAFISYLYGDEILFLYIKMVLTIPAGCPW